VKPRLLTFYLNSLLHTNPQCSVLEAFRVPTCHVKKVVSALPRLTLHC